MNNLIQEYYLENKLWLKMALRWFCLAAIAGAITYLIRPDLIQQISDLFKDKFGPDPAPDIHLAKEIFVQNSIACLIALLGGILFGISSFLILFFNGFIIGFIVMALLFIPGNPVRNVLYIFAGLLPHGIFELPAFFVASALGIRLGTEWLKADKAGNRWGVLRENFKRIFIALPIFEILLIIAALVEVFVSGRLIANY